MKKNDGFSIKKFATRLFTLRNEAGYTQEEVCKLLLERYQYERTENTTKHILCRHCLGFVWSKHGVSFRR